MQLGGAVPTSPWELVASAGLETKVVLVVLAVFSAISWFIIIAKAWQFARLRRGSQRFFAAVQHAVRLDEARQAVAELPPSPFTRLFHEGLNFYSELVPGGLSGNRPDGGVLAGTQLEALRMVLGAEVYQKGSNITEERLRFDFSCPRRLTSEELARVEKIVNAKITEDMPVSWEEMAVEEAKQKGAIGIFTERYGEKVKVYRIGDPSIGSGQV